MIKQQTNLLTYMHRDQHFLSSNATENETDTVCDIYVLFVKYSNTLISQIYDINISQCI